MGCAIQPHITHTDALLFGACWFPVHVSAFSAIPAQSRALLHATTFINNPVEHMLGNHLWLWVLVALRSAWLAKSWNAGSVAFEEGSGMTRIKDNLKNAENDAANECQDRVKERKKLKDRVDSGVNFLSWRIVIMLLEVCFLSYWLLWRGQKRLHWCSLFDSSCNTTVCVFGCLSRWLIRPSRSS